MARASVAAENQGLDALAGSLNSPTNLLAYVSLHTGDPSTTGANEVSGGSYVRQACTWNAASNGSKTNVTMMTFQTPGTTPVTFFGGWSAATAGTYGIGAALTSSVTAATITVAAGALSFSAS